MQEVYELWHEATKPPTYADSTYKVYEQHYNNYVNEIFADKVIGSIKGIPIQKYVNIMKEKYSPEVVNKCINLLINIYSFAGDTLKCVNENPVSGIIRCKVPRKKDYLERWYDHLLSRPSSCVRLSLLSYKTIIDITEQIHINDRIDIVDPARVLRIFLDNAIEAALPSEEKYICFSATNKPNGLYISIQNSTILLKLLSPSKKEGTSTKRKR